jgi:acetyl-CoA acetyltransferase
MTLKKDAYAIVGLGVTRQGRLPEMTNEDIKVEGLRLALEDAGLKAKEINGWIYQQGVSDMWGFCTAGGVPKILGFDPGFMFSVQAGGGTAVGLFMLACAAIDAGQADYVAVGYGDNMLSSSQKIGASGTPARPADRDNPGTFGMFGPAACHSLAAQRHMSRFGTTKEQLGEIAVTQREYANRRPDAFLHDKRLTMDDYLKARPIAGPLGKYDCCLTSDGGCAFIVTSAERARSMKQRPVYISGIGFGHDLDSIYNRTQYEELGIRRAKDQTLKMADVAIGDIDVAQIYDCFTITVLLTLEGWGFCKKGEGGAYVADGNLRMTGKCPTNTHGGELSWGYMQGFTPIVEGILQLRGEGGATQVKDAELCLVTGHGGNTFGAAGSMEYQEAGLILRRG